ncbi:hypothetical protein [Cognatilysobacter lacus]|uniref:Transmembrane protein n=1 Tax=Cognatilysobacter lacus TaxID=1643323 RepID=A0A5D8Z6B4_9GAMM|nr:hypothetical protein [Lysobacter lacus]TZF89583.1 hypothetical protein FW784_08640 [Lysobacter lacus]
MDDPMPQARPAFAWLLLPVVILGFAALWALAALYSGRQCSFMAVVGAVDVLWVLSLAPASRVGPRALLATVATAVLVLLANWAIIAVNVGAPLGLGPIDAMDKLGPHHALTLARLANTGIDAVWIALALAVAIGGPALSARRRALSTR